MPQCLTFQCQEMLPGTGRCVLRERSDQLRDIIVHLVRDAMPDNWHDDDLPASETAAWRAAMEAVGIDPETMK